MFVAALLLLTFTSLVASFPQWLTLPAVLVSVLGLMLGGWSVVRANRTLAWCTVVLEALLFVLSLTVQLAFESFRQTLPALLLSYVMILFSVEALDLIGKHSSAHSIQMYALEAPRGITMMWKSAEHVFGMLMRLPILFGGGFILALVTMILGSYFASVSSVLSDISVYVVAVSISLALLLVLRE
jgi:hypothetical protein